MRSINYLYLFFLLLAFGPLKAQHTPFIEIEYETTLQVNPYLPSSERTVLQIFGDRSLYTYDQRPADAPREVEGTNNRTYMLRATDEFGWAILHNIPTGQLVQRRFYRRSPIKVIDSYASLNWTILPEKKQIGSFECIRAEGYFRGRHYTAWFAPDIPFPAGPWKLGGLPGAILEATDETGDVSFLFSAYRVDLSGEHEPLKLPPTDESMDSLQDFLATIKERSEARMRMLEASSDHRVKAWTIEPKPGHRLAIETIYEWEEE